jgi:putative phosphoribosyl transferase
MADEVALEVERGPELGGGCPRAQCPVPTMAYRLQCTQGMTQTTSKAPMVWGIASVPFRDRRQAGGELAHALRSYAAERPIVIALPRGGVPVGYEIARSLRAPLDVCIVRKLGVPWYPELGLGAVAEGGHIDLSREMMQSLAISGAELAELVALKRREVEERVARYRSGLPLPELATSTVLLVDDGIATGGTVRAALGALRARHPAKIVLAAPVIAEDTLEQLAHSVDQIVCLVAPRDLHSVGLWYRDFTQVTDDEVVQLLAAARRPSRDEARRGECDDALA